MPCPARLLGEEYELRQPSGNSGTGHRTLSEHRGKSTSLSRLGNGTAPSWRILESLLSGFSLKLSNYSWLSLIVVFSRSCFLNANSSGAKWMFAFFLIKVCGEQVFLKKDLLCFVIQFHRRLLLDDILLDPTRKFTQAISDPRPQIPVSFGFAHSSFFLASLALRRWGKGSTVHPTCFTWLLPEQGLAD